MVEQTTIEIDQSNRISSIWIIPVLALVVGLWLGVKELNERGPNIEMTFLNASGVMVEKTKIKYKDVDIGKVTGLRLSDDLSKVYVSAEMSKDIAPHLSESTLFWVVRPTVSVAGVSGLSTLFSGVHIAMDPGERGKPTDSFEGLEQPPAIRSDTPGKVFTLRAQELGSVSEGTPVFFREIRVGEVTKYSIDQQDGWIEISIFIPEPYARWVNKRSRFWNISGLKINVGTDGISAEAGPLSSLILGGIAFNIGSLENTPADEGSYFFLYENHDAVIEGSFRLKYPYVLHFNESVRGLKVGASVEYKGIKVGNVTQVELHGDSESSAFGVNVYINIEPQRFDSTNLVKREVMDAEIRMRIEHGLRAQLKTSSVVLGALYVDLVEQPDESGLVLSNNTSEIPSIPTIPGQFHELTRQLTAMVERLDKLPVTKIGNDLKASVTSIRNIMTKIDRNNTADNIDQLLVSVKNSSEKLNVALGNLSSTLDSTNQFIKTSEDVIDPTNQLHFELIRMMEEVRKAARSVDTLTTNLQNNPESLIFGKGK